MTVYKKGDLVMVHDAHLAVYIRRLQGFSTRGTYRNVIYAFGAIHHCMDIDIKKAKRASK